jgi:polysaccharide biosynthesis protein PslH
MTYGLESEAIPRPEDMERSRRQVREEQGIPPDETLLFFNGAFNYSPNLNALQKIIDKINPLLLERGTFPYKILICGRDIPEAVSKRQTPNILFAGFVEDIEVYFRGADIFLNPVTEGGGIKTKLVEALGNNLTSVSVRNGAMGIDPSWCNGKLLVCEDGEWDVFVELILKARAVTADTPPLYFEHFYWGTTTRKAAEFIMAAGKKKPPVSGG